MAWEIPAIWFIVATTLVLFIRDERRIRLQQLSERARAFATAPEWRHRAPPPRQAGLLLPKQDLTALQRRFAQEMRRSLR